MSTLVSVVIPTYNRRDELRYAIESALAQSIEVEVIVVDDGSDDGTADFVAEYARVRLVALPRTGQLGVVRNEGIARARGEFVAFLDSDDAWEASKLSRQLRVMQAHSGLVAGGTNAFAVAATGSRTSDRVYFPDRMADEVLTPGALLAINPLIVSTVVVRTDAVRRVGGFATIRLLHAIEDYDLWLRLSALGTLHYLGEPLAWYTDTPSSSMRGERSRAQEILGLLVILHRQQDQWVADPDLLSAIHSRTEELLRELAILSGRRLMRRIASVRHSRPDLKLWFGPAARSGMLTIGRRDDASGYPDAACDAYVDVDELWFPEGSVAAVGTSATGCAVDVGPIVETGAAARPWLSDQGRLVVECDPGEGLAASSVASALAEVGFETTRVQAESGRIELRKRP